jgi:hypothetical protein
MVVHGMQQEPQGAVMQQQTSQQPQHACTQQEQEQLRSAERVQQEQETNKFELPAIAEVRSKVADATSAGAAAEPALGTLAASSTAAAA